MKKNAADLEFEKSKAEILKRAREVTKNPEREEAEFLRKVETFTSEAYNLENEKKYAWEYEIEQYRKTRMKERFYMFGSICGILGFILIVILHFSDILEILMRF